MQAYSQAKAERLQPVLGALPLIGFGKAGDAAAFRLAPNLSELVPNIFLQIGTGQAPGRSGRERPEPDLTLPRQACHLPANPVR